MYGDRLRDVSELVHYRTQACRVLRAEAAGSLVNPTGHDHETGVRRRTNREPITP